MPKTVILIFSGTDEVTPTMQKISGEMGHVGKAAEQASSGAGLLGKALGVIGGLWATDKVIGYAESLTHLASSAEDYRGKLEILMKSETAAAQTYEAMKKLVTPFKTDELEDAAVRLETFGISAQKYMLGLADAAAATKRPLMDMVQTVAMAGEGNIRGLRQLGINSLDILRQTGAQSIMELTSSEAGLQKIMEAALQLMGEKFAGAAAKEAKDWDGMTVRLGNAWRGFETKIMESGVFQIMETGLTRVMAKIDELKANGTLDVWAQNAANAIVKGFEIASYAVQGFAQLTTLAISGLTIELVGFLEEIDLAAAAWQNILKYKQSVGQALGGLGSEGDEADLKAMVEKISGRTVEGPINGPGRDLQLGLTQVAKLRADIASLQSQMLETGAASYDMAGKIQGTFDSLRAGAQSIVADSRAIDQIPKSWLLVADSVKKAGDDTKNLSKEMQDLQGAYDKAMTALQRETALAGLTDAEKAAVQYKFRLEDIEKQFGKMGPVAVAALEAQAKGAYGAAEAARENAARIKELNDEWQAAGQAADIMAQSYLDAMSDSEREAANAVLTTSKLVEAWQRANVPLEIQVEWLKQLDINLDKIKTNKAADEFAKQQEEAAKKSQEAWDNYAQNVEQSSQGVFRSMLDGTSNIFDTIFNLFKDLVAHMAAYAFTNQIVLPVTASVFSAVPGLSGLTGLSGTGGSGFGLPGSGFGGSLLSQPLWGGTANTGAWGITGGGVNGFGTLGGMLGGLFGGGLTGYGMSGVPGGILGGGLGLGGYLGGTALAGAMGIGGMLGSIVPGIGTILGGLVGGLIGKLFGGEPDYWSEAKITMPGGKGLKGFTGAKPSSMLQSWWLSDTAKDASGMDEAAVQKIFDTYVSGVQKTFQGLYDAAPEMLQTAWDEMEIPSWETLEKDEGKNVGKKLTYQMRAWLSTVDFTVTQTMMDTAADVFGETAGMNQSAIDKISAAWMKRDNDFFKSLLDKYDMSSETDLDELTTEYKTYITNFFTGIGKAMTYMAADPLGEILDAINQTPIDQAAAQFKSFDTQINFVMDSLDELTGQDYAAAIANIGDLLTQRYNLEIQYITQLSDMLKSSLDSLGSQQQGYEVELMNPQQKQDYYWKKQNEDFAKFWAETDPTKATSDMQKWQADWDKYWQTLPTAADIAANPDQYAAGAMTKEDALTKYFNPAVEAASTKITGEFSAAIQTVIDGHNNTAASLKALGSATDDLKTQISAAATEVKTFIQALRDLPDSIQITVDTSASEVGS